MNEIKFNEPLKSHTTFKIGGPAKIFFRPPDLKDLRSVVICAKQANLPVFILGAGSNLLVNDKGVRGVVLKLDSDFFKNAGFKGNCLLAGSGVLLSEIVRQSKNKGLTGAEFLAGIPGTLGGALSMNAGAWEKSIGDLVESADVMDYRGAVKTLDRSRIKFFYRQSSLSKYIILGARLKFTKRNKREIGETIKGYLSRRRQSQDVSFPNAGCVFKNPRRLSAGRLIDECGLKGKRSGNAAISLKHANFILNRGNAKASDVLKLMDLVRRQVKGRFDIDLEPELKVWK
jgi:UDP-N-acetylmuramate dehydrogenase